MQPRRNHRLALADSLRTRIAVSVASFVIVFTAGCERGPSVSIGPFPQVRVGAPVADAARQVGREGKSYEHDQLPTIPRPRQTYKGLPESTTWLVWWNDQTGMAELTLGVLDGQVIYKSVLYMEDNERKGASWTLPEFER